MFMQAGFAFMGIAKILVNFSIATIAWWACGFALAFGGDGAIIGDSGFFFSVGSTIKGGIVAGPVNGSTTAFMLFQFMLCAVSLAIVWGTTLERLKFVAYVIYAVVFAAVIYPLSAHWIFGGGFLGEIGGGVQDFAGSTVVHLVGATGALACLLLLGARRGKYGPDGKPRAIPGHSMPLVGLGVLILWLGWFGFNGGSTLGTSGSRFAEVMLVTQLGAAAGVIGACLVTYFKTRSLDVGMAGNGAIAGLVGITAPSGYVEFWAAPIIGLAVGIAAAFVTVFVLSIGTFWAIKKTVGLRVDAEAEEAGLDIAEHGMYGYPEQFIPQPELFGNGGYRPTVVGTPLAVHSEPAETRAPAARRSVGEPQTTGA